MIPAEGYTYRINYTSWEGRGEVTEGEQDVHAFSTWQSFRAFARWFRDNRHGRYAIIKSTKMDGR